MAKTKIGLIGVGGMGRVMADLVQKSSSEVEITAVYDPDQVSVDRCVKQLSYTGRVCDSLAELLATNCDWVMIASLNSQHAEHVTAAFAAGKHVFCQKPLATSLTDCLRMRAAWQAANKQFVIGFTLRYSPHYRKIRALIAAGKIGDIISIDFNETIDFNHGGFIVGDWRRDSSLSGSHLLEKCCHDIDVLNWMVDERASRVASFGGLNFFVPENVHHIERLGKNNKGQDAYLTWPNHIGVNPFTSEKDIVDNQVILLEYPSGVRASFHINSNAAIPERRIYICGTEGAIRADVMSGVLEYKAIGFETELENLATGVAGMHGGGDAILAQELVDLMAGDDHLSASLQDGLNSAVTCFAIDDAMAKGEVVDMQDYWRQVDMSL